MADQYLLDSIRETIENSVSPCFHNTSLTELYVMCPECGHTSHKGSAHYYIAMFPPFKTFCQKCGKKGVLNHQTLEELNIYNNDLELMIREANKDLKGNSSSTVNYIKQKNVFDYEDESNDRTQASLDYVNNRFNSSFTIDELNNRFKCVADPVKFLKEKRVDVSKYKFDFSKSVGFVSSDNMYLICRDISGEQECRYSNVKLTDDQDASKIYNIRMPINRMNPVTTLVITEGIFDAIGVYNAFYKDAENTIIAAGCGKSWTQVINKFKKLGYLILNVEIYSDNDVELKKYSNINKSTFIQPTLVQDTQISKTGINKVTVYYNELGKDTGVPPEKIKRKGYRLS